MNGFVPVTKENLAIMLSSCLAIIETDYKEELNKTVNHLIASETRRTTESKWYRLFILPKPRFDYNAADVIEWSGKQEYPIFEMDPFESLEKDKEHSIGWVKRLFAVADSTFAGEPIQLDLKTFQRISNPSRYRWVSATGFCYTLRD